MWSYLVWFGFWPKNQTNTFWKKNKNLSQKQNVWTEISSALIYDLVSHSSLPSHTWFFSKEIRTEGGFSWEKQPWESETTTTERREATFIILHSRSSNESKLAANQWTILLGFFFQLFCLGFFCKFFLPSLKLFSYNESHKSLRNWYFVSNLYLRVRLGAKCPPASKRQHVAAAETWLTQDGKMAEAIWAGGT